jgi:putative salt-induced outer membrane protein YdiY
MTTHKSLLLIGAASVYSLAACAQTSSLVSTNAVIKYPWQNAITAGLSLTRGNSQSLLASLKVTGDKKTPVNEYSLDADGAYGSANSVPNNETLHGFAQWNYLFSDRWYADLRAEGLHDGIAELKYRGTFTAGAGYYFIKSAATTLAGEVGPGYITQRVGTDSQNFATLRVAERGEHKFSQNGARVWETVEFLPEVDKWSNYLVNAEVGAEAGLYKSISLQVCVDNYYNSEPASGRRRDDVKLVSGITYNF